MHAEPQRRTFVHPGLDAWLLLLDLETLYVEDERAVGWDVVTHFLVAVGEVCGDCDASFAADLDALHAYVPALWLRMISLLELPSVMFDLP